MEDRDTKRILSDICNKLDQIGEAFPKDEQGNIDARGHREFHEAAIESAKAEEKFWRELRQDLIRKGLWSVLLVVIGLILTGAAVKMGIHHG